MDQRAMTLYLASKRLSAAEIYADLVATLGAESVNHPSVAQHLRQANSRSRSQISFF
jgi:hypothetical protein